MRNRPVLLLFVTFVMIPLSALECQGAPPVPSFGAGQILQQVQPNIQVPQSLPKAVIKNKRPQKSIPLSKIRVKVKHFVIIGNTLFKTKILHKLVVDGEGRSLTFDKIQFYADRITAFYKKHGYILSRAVLPVQTIKNGRVTIRVIEARYGKILFHNKSRVSDSLVRSTLSDLVPGMTVKGPLFDSDLLLLSDIPGTKITSTFSPGSTPNTSDFDVDVLGTSMFNGSIGVNDYGDPYVGSLQMTGTGALNNIFHHGDTLTITVTSAFAGFNYGRITYETLLNGAGTRVGAGYSALDYRLGGGISPIGYAGNASILLALGASGYAQTMSAWIIQPLVRRTRYNLMLTLDYDYDILSDTFDQATGAGNNRSLDVVNLTISGNTTDNVWGGGINNASITFAPYDLTMGAGMSSAIDPYFNSTIGFRSVWRGLISRSQTLPGKDNSFFVSGNGQWASGALDPIQQYVMGGPQSVRGYATAVLFGDDGYTTTAELRHLSLFSSFPGTFQSSAFFDAGGVSYNSSFLTLMGTGLGESWQGPKGWLASIQLATPIGGIPLALGGSSATSPVEAWFLVEKTF